MAQNIATKSVTNTKIALACALLIAAGGLAFAAAAVPTSTPKCGTNSTSFSNACSGGYRKISFTCFDGASYTKKVAACTSSKDLRAMADAQCANACKGSQPKKWVCDDDDGGINYNQAGTAKAKEQQGTTVISVSTGQDVCVSATSLTEFSCAADGRLASSTYDCATEGKTCAHGACVQCTTANAATACNDNNDQTREGCNAGTYTCEYTLVSTGEVCKQPVALPAEETRPAATVCGDTLCTDSDIANASAAGTTSGLDPSSLGYQRRTLTDSCESGTRVKEYSCTGSPQILIASSTYSCPVGQICTDGACVTPSPCSDSDNFNAYVPGTTEGLLENQTTRSFMQDVCSGENTLDEYSCAADGFHIFRSIMECDYGCQQGACVLSNNTSCTDMDGSNFFVRGTTGTTTDYCFQDGVTSTVMEGLCAGGVEVHIPAGCMYGCENGACRTAPSSQGVLPSVSCYDGDQSEQPNQQYFNNRVVYSSNAFGERSAYDYCTSPTDLVEFSCSDATTTSVTASLISCPNGCQSGRCRR